MEQNLSGHYERALELARTYRRYKTDDENIVIPPESLANTVNCLEKIKNNHIRGQQFTRREHRRLAEAIFKDTKGQFFGIEETKIRTNAGVLAAALLVKLDTNQHDMEQLGLKLQSTLSEADHAALARAKEQHATAEQDAMLVAMVASDTNASLEIAAQAVFAGSIAFDRSVEITGDFYAAGKAWAGAVDDVLLANGCSELSGELASREEIYAGILQGETGFRRREVSDDELAVITEHTENVD